MHFHTFDCFQVISYLCCCHDYINIQIVIYSLQK